jgi:F-type H+-transporting ATPase subunit a
MKGMMGAEEARKHFPIIGTLAFYIFMNNALALIPGGAPATANLNTNIVMGLTVFVATHVSGIRVQGVVAYAKHFMGPMLALAPLMIIVELISHLVRPISLSLRLLGNMTGDHKVMEIFLGFHIPLVPLPLMFLGFMVVCIQTMVFVLLSTVYLSLAVEKHDHGHDQGHDGHGHAAHGH